MSMITKCPACGTSFRVTPQQLQAQHGMVRCGRCATVFDGFKELATQRDVSPLEAPPSAVAVHGEARIAEVSKPPTGELARPTPELQSEPSRPAPATPAAVRPVIAPEPVTPTPLRPAVTPAPATPAPVQAVIAPEPVVPEPLQAIPDSTTPAAVRPVVAPEPVAPIPLRPVVTRAPATPAPVKAVIEPEPQVATDDAQFESVPVPRRRSGGLALGIFLLLLALAAQGVYFYRGDIAAYVPEARPYLNRMCEQLRCTVALPQRPRSISIEASDLQATDPSNPGLITLTATLRNQATTTLGYPALDVVLTNAKEHTVARRIFLPTEYLDAGKDARAGIPPNAEMTVKLDIDSGDLGAAGFRLDLLAAPER